MEQQRIAKFLDEKTALIDDIITDTKQTIEELKSYKQSLISEIVTKGINKNVKLVPSGIKWIGTIPEGWQVVSIKSFLQKRKEILEKWTDENVLSLTMNGVVIRDLENPSGKMPATFDGYQKIYKGNLVLCLFDIDVTPRCVGIAYDDGITSPAYSQYIIKEGDLRFYYYLLLMMDNDKILLQYSRTLRSTLTDEYFGAVKVAIPKSIIEQQRIAKFLDEKTALIDSFIAEKYNLISEYENYKKSMIYEYVTGKKRVDIDEGDMN